MPWRSPSPKHFKWWARSSFVEAISQSSFVGSGCSVQQSAFAESYPSWPSPLSQPRLTATVRVPLQVRVQDVLGRPRLALTGGDGAQRIPVQWSALFGIATRPHLPRIPQAPNPGDTRGGSEWPALGRCRTRGGNSSRKAALDPAKRRPGVEAPEGPFRGGQPAQRCAADVHVWLQGQKVCHA